MHFDKKIDFFIQGCGNIRLEWLVSFPYKSSKCEQLSVNNRVIPSYSMSWSKQIWDKMKLAQLPAKVVQSASVN